MAMGALQHINIRCADAQRSRDFYVDIMGLTEGPRPPFASRGYWLYLGPEPVVHLVQKPDGEPVRGPGTGDLDHIAFAGHELDAFKAVLTAAGVPFREAVVPRDQTIQIFVLDPDGVQLELNFPDPGPGPMA
jgi:catechol 2,3-dioxygenase-like lactoylglutathione lyase family enzyme